MLCKILQDFKGSQDGLITTDLKKGEVVDVSDYLMGCIDKSWVSSIEGEPEIENEADSENENESENHDESEAQADSENDEESKGESENEADSEKSDEVIAEIPVINNKAVVTDGKQSKAGKNK